MLKWLIICQTTIPNRTSNELLNSPSAINCLNIIEHTLFLVYFMKIMSLNIALCIATFLQITYSSWGLKIACNPRLCTHITHLCVGAAFWHVISILKQWSTRPQDYVRSVPDKIACHKGILESMCISMASVLSGMLHCCEKGLIVWFNF